ncbi:oxidoreductase [Streptomyces sp. NPDC054787]
MTSHTAHTAQTAQTAQTAHTITAAASGTWTLGDSTVHRMGFGAMRLPQTGEALVQDAVPRDRDEAIGVLRRAVELGVNHIDTAAFYFSPLRSANELISRALAPYPDDLVLATKVGPARGPSGAWLSHATPEQLRGQVEENLRQLGRDHLDVVNLRIVGTDSIAERFGALAELRQAGLIRHLGLSNIHPHHLAEALAIAPVVCVQNRYGIGIRPDHDAFVRSCGEQGIAFVPFYAIAGTGREAGASGAEHEEVLAVARAHGASAAQVRLAWTLHRGAHVLAIPGTGDLGHLADNVAAGALRLSEDALAALDALHRRGVQEASPGAQ